MKKMEFHFQLKINKYESRNSFQKNKLIQQLYYDFVRE